MFDAIVRAPERRIGLTIFADTAFPGVKEWGDAPLVKVVPVRFSRWSRARAQLWEQFVFPGLCARLGCTIAHHPITTNPVIKRGVKSVVTLHDLNFFLHPQWYSRRFITVYRLTALPGLRRAERVVAVSRYVQDQAAQHLKLPSQRLRCIYNGIKHKGASSPISNSARQPPYLLTVGSLQPHKNLARLLDAFESLLQDFPSLELWVVGRAQPRFRRDEHALAQPARPGVKVLGYLSEEALLSAYHNAAAFCYPSLEEGFGLPLLEAMQAGVPVITSNCSCLPEIAGPGAELANPWSTTSIADAIRKVLNLDPREREERTRAGREWASRFSWKTAAAAYLDIYAELLSG